MKETQMHIDDRIFELLGNDELIAPQMAEIVSREYGLTRDEAFERIRAVYKERSTPRLARISEALERMAANIPKINPR